MFNFTDVNFFAGYSYVAPSILFSENVISDQIWMQATGQKPDKLKGWVAKVIIQFSFLFIRVVWG